MGKILKKHLPGSKKIPYFALLKKKSIFLNSIKHQPMSRICQITGKRPITGHRVSHSNIKTNRWFYPNIQTKKFFVPEENRWITLKVSTKGIRTINKKGIYASLLEARKKGFIQ